MNLTGSLLAACCLVSATASRVAHRDDPEFMVDTFGVHRQQTSFGAFDGRNYMILWRDYRNRDTTDIYGMRMSPEGIRLDSHSFAVSIAPSWQEYPVTAFDGTNYLAVWEDRRNNPAYSDVYGARVTPAGEALDPEGIPISTELFWQATPAIAFDGTNYVVVWEDYRDDPYADVCAARVRPEGTVLDPQGIKVSAEPLGQWLPNLVFDGTNYFVVWADFRRGGNFPNDIYGARVTPDLTLLDPGGIPICTAARNQYEPAVAFDGSGFLVVWTDERSESRRDIYGARVTAAGEVLDPDGIHISTTGTWQWNPAAAFDGTDYVVVWRDDRSGGSGPDDIYGARVTPDGRVLACGPVVTQEGNQRVPHLVRGFGSQLLLTYTSWTGTVGGKTYACDRVWGKFGPFPGVEEAKNAERGIRNAGATIVRGMLRVDSQLTAGLRPELLDAAGRRVMELKPGVNDVRQLSPGVYFARSGFPTALDMTEESPRVIRVVVTK